MVLSASWIEQCWSQIKRWSFWDNKQILCTTIIHLQSASYTCLDCKTYLFKFKNLFVRIAILRHQILCTTQYDCSYVAIPSQFLDIWCLAFDMYKIFCQIPPKPLVFWNVFSDSDVCLKYKCLSSAVFASFCGFDYLSWAHTTPYSIRGGWWRS